MSLCTGQKLTSGGPLLARKAVSDEALGVVATYLSRPALSSRKNATASEFSAFGLRGPHF